MKEEREGDTSKDDIDGDNKKKRSENRTSKNTRNTGDGDLKKNKPKQLI